MKSQGFQSYERSVFCSVPALRHCRCTMAPSAGLTVIKLTDVPTWEACGFLMLFETLKQSDTWFRALSIVWRACKLLEARSHGKSVSSFRGTGTYDILWLRNSHPVSFDAPSDFGHCKGYSFHPQAYAKVRALDTGHWMTLVRWTRHRLNSESLNLSSVSKIWNLSASLHIAIWKI